MSLKLRKLYLEGRYNLLLAPLQELMKFRKIPDHLAHFELGDSPNLQLFNDHSLLSRRVFWLGHKGYEQNTINFWMQLCKSHSHVVEIGANMGYFTIHGMYANPELIYKAIEPHPGSFRYLVKNIKLNGLNKVETIEAAVTGKNAPEKLMLRIPNINSDDSSPTGAFLETVEGLGRKADKAIEVKTIDGTALIQGADLLKLDVEGSEYAILDSVKREIIEYKPTILVEVLRNTDKLRILIRNLAMHHDYLIFAIGNQSLYAIQADEITDIVLQSRFKTRDVILIQKGRLQVEKSEIKLDQFKLKTTAKRKVAS